MSPAYLSNVQPVQKPLMVAAARPVWKFIIYLKSNKKNYAKAK